ncbi:MAG: aspartate/glutamate racemase family protein [Roseibium sp.]
MNERSRITLIHATRLAIDPIEKAAQEHWPEADVVTILEEGLSKDRLKTEQLTPELSDRILGLAHYAELAGSDGVLFTCSAFGSAIENAAAGSPIPVMKPNEAMFNQAFRTGDRAALIYTFGPAARGMEAEFRNAAVAKKPSATITSYFCEGALDAKQNGDDVLHDQLIAETAASVTDADVILLAQFSMASAAPLARNKTAIPVLTSPDAAILEIRERVESRQKGAAKC